MNEYEENIVNELRKKFKPLNVSKTGSQINIHSFMFKLSIEIIETSYELLIAVRSIEVRKLFRRKGIFTKVIDILEKQCNTIVFSGVCSSASYHAMKKWGAKKAIRSDRDSSKYVLYDESSINKNWKYFEKNYGCYYKTNLN